jgi:hypothetical protein
MISLFCAAVVAWPIGALAKQSAHTRYTDALNTAKHAYERNPHPTEAARVAYLTELVRLREKAARGNDHSWEPIDAEIKRHPAPANSDSAALTSLRVGDWQSPRHDYRYLADGTWTMLPVDDNTTNGTWRIEGNQDFEIANIMPDKDDPLTIILATKKDFVFADKDGDIFYETRLK